MSNLNHPEIDPDRMEKWNENVLPVPSAERLKGKGSPDATCSACAEELKKCLEAFKNLEAFTRQKLSEYNATPCEWDALESVLLSSPNAKALPQAGRK